jgi:hypothetical protein
MHDILLVVAGFATSWLATRPELGTRAGLIAAGAFGVVLAAYSWLHLGVRSVGRLAAVAAAVIVVQILMVSAASFAVELLYIFRFDIVTTGPVVTAVAGATAAALIASFIFFLPSPSQREPSGLEMVCCAIGGALGCFTPNFEDAGARSVLQLPLWNAGVAAAIGLVSHLRSFPAPSSKTSLQLLTALGFVGVCAAVVFGDSLRSAMQPAPVPVDAARSAAIREARIKSVKEAPPFAELPAIDIVPAREMFIADPIDGVVCDPPSGDALGTDIREIESHRLRVPARRQYQVECRVKTEDPKLSSTLRVKVVQYPNDAWARYDIRFQQGEQGLRDSIDVQTVSRDDRPVFVIKSTALWVSGDKVIVVNWSQPSRTWDGVVGAYLEKYPNTLDRDFDLPYLPPY